MTLVDNAPHYTTLCSTPSSPSSSTYLNRPISLTHNLQTNPLPPIIQHNSRMLSRNNCTRHLLRHIILRIRIGERLPLRNGQETSIQGTLQVTLVATNRVVHRDQVRAGGERTLDLELDQGRDDGREDVATTEHRLADGH